MTNEYVVAGLMSGTSLDGLDIAVCRFCFEEKWSFEIISAKTFDYTSEWKSKLARAHEMNGLELTLLHTELGTLHGNLLKEFISNLSIQPDFISSHGHTVFHQPEKQMTLQIGSAPHIAAATTLPVIADFRTTDVALNGQGAPLVPIGDLLLFSEYALCLNLGGIANISIKNKNSIKAFDVCPCNMMLNHIAAKIGLDYDHGGELASKGAIHPEMLNELNALAFYKLAPPKSLGKEFFDAEIFPLMNKYDIHPNDLLRTLVEHTAIQISHTTNSFAGAKMLVTGGGALNSFLMERIKSHCNVEVILPDPTLIQFKEALIFAFLGVLRLREENNCLREVTGADRDHCGGAIYLP